MFIGNRNITTNCFRVQAFDSVISGWFCIRFIDCMLKGKSLLEYIDLFSPNEYKKKKKNNKTKIFSISSKKW